MRYGKFLVYRDFLTSPTAPDLFRMLAFVPTRVQYLPETDQMEMVGISPSFEQCDLDRMYNEYEVNVINVIEDGVEKIIQVKVNRIAADEAA